METHPNEGYYKSRWICIRQEHTLEQSAGDSPKIAFFTPSYRLALFRKISCWTPCDRIESHFSLPIAHLEKEANHTVFFGDLNPERNTGYYRPHFLSIRQKCVDNTNSSEYPSSLACFRNFFFLPQQVRKKHMLWERFEKTSDVQLVTPLCFTWVAILRQIYFRFFLYSLSLCLF